MITYKKDGIEIAGEFISLDDVISKCNEVKIKEEDSVLLKIGWNARGGSVYEHRVYPKKTANKIKKLITGKFCYFGEIWGKHSEVCGNIQEEHIKIIKNKSEIKEFLSSYPDGFDYDHSFIEALVDRYDDYGGREYWEEQESKEYCDDIEELIKIW